jgi:biopolymer transport protein ExbD
MAAFASGNVVRGIAADINITPLVDVLLVLLVIFMLAAPIATQRLALTNAQPCAANCPPPADPVRLAIKRTGELYWNGAPLTRAALAGDLAALARDPQVPPLEIRIEGAARYALLTDVLAAAQDAGVSRIAVAPGNN